MRILRSFAAAAMVAIIPTFSLGATIDAGAYSVTDIDHNNVVRSIWTPDGSKGPNANKALVTGGDASAYWSFSDTVMTFDGTNAEITGQATNTGTADLKFDLALSFTLNPVTQDGYCQFDGVDKGCNNGPYAGGDPDTWTYFDFVEGTFTGVAGTDMAGALYNIGDNLMHRAQAGIGANALVAGDFGFSMWFTFTRDATSATQSANGEYNFLASGKGDINVDLAPVPLPAAGWLLLASVGGLAVAKRRRKS